MPSVVLRSFSGTGALISQEPVFISLWHHLYRIEDIFECGEVTVTDG